MDTRQARRGSAGLPWAMADEVLALHRLQKLVGHAVQPEFTDVPEEYGDVDQIVRSFQLEKVPLH